MRFAIITLSLTALLCGCGAPEQADNGQAASSAVMYHNGDILTMAGDQPEYAEALVVQDGKILFVGAADQAMEVAGPGHRMVDLQGRTLLPGFVDAHGHVFLCGFQALAADLLPPPDGTVRNIADLVARTREWASKNGPAIERSGWIIAFGYDDAQLEERRHPTADELDSVSLEVPVLVMHQSGHLGAMNHKGLELVGYTADAPDPKGGVVRRKEGSREPNGVLEEMAMFIPVFGVFDDLDEEANEKIALAGLEAYARFGFTTAQEGRATGEATETWRKLGRKGLLTLDVVSYPDIQKELAYMKEVGSSTTYIDHVRVGGVKISLDGSPQGKTAWLTEPYVVPPPGEGPDYTGYPAFPEEQQVVALIDSAFSNDWQVLAHCNGDAAADQFIRAVRQAADRHGNEDRRSVMIHAQTVREDQLDSMQALGIIPSFFGMHTFYWGDWHRDETLGPERARRISPARSALDRGMRFTEHHDAPVALPSSIMVLHTAVNRTSRSGDVIGEDQRISPYIALKAITEWAAYQHFEEDRKGTLEAGKLADLVILDGNPLKVAPEAIMEIQVLETIKEGETVYRREG